MFIQVVFSLRSMGAVDLAEVDDDEAKQRRECDGKKNAEADETISGVIC